MEQLRPSSWQGTHNYSKSTPLPTTNLPVDAWQLALSHADPSPHTHHASISSTSNHPWTTILPQAASSPQSPISPHSPVYLAPPLPQIRPPRSTKGVSEEWNDRVEWSQRLLYVKPAEETRAPMNELEQRELDLLDHRMFLKFKKATRRDAGGEVAENLLVWKAAKMWYHNFYQPIPEIVTTKRCFNPFSEHFHLWVRKPLGPDDRATVLGVEKPWEWKGLKKLERLYYPIAWWPGLIRPSIEDRITVLEVDVERLIRECEDCEGRGKARAESDGELSFQKTVFEDPAVIGLGLIGAYGFDV